MNTLLAITGIGILAMIAEIFRFRKVILPLALIGLLLAGFFAINYWDTNIRYFGDMMYFDNYAIGFSLILIVSSMLWFILASDSLRSDNHTSDITALIAFSLAGGIVMVSYANLTMLFLGIEILSVALYVLAASDKRNLRSNEAGFKYFIMGAFATGFFLFGVALIYGAVGSFNLQEIASFISVNKSDLPNWLYAGILLIIVGMGFKISAAPFHFWAPDVYQGSPSTITAYMSTVVKIAAFGAMLRLFMVCFSQIANWWSPVLIALSVASMLWGNIMATRQSSIKRLLAYSSIAHAGYMLLAIVAMNELSTKALLIYGAAYSIASIGVFALVTNMAENENEKITSLHGLSKTHPVSAVLLSILIFSLAGIPPLAGFFGKYYTFYAALQGGFMIPVLVAVVSSLIGFLYYLNVVISIYRPSDSDSESFRFTPNQNIILWISSILTVLIGLFPSQLLQWFS